MAIFWDHGTLNVKTAAVDRGGDSATGHTIIYNWKIYDSINHGGSIAVLFCNSMY